MTDDGRESDPRGFGGGEEASPWTGKPPRPVFAVLWSTGPDPGLDGLLRLQAIRTGEGGERFDRWCAPSSSEGDDPGRDGRVSADFGAAALEAEPDGEAAEIWREFAEFAGKRLVVVADGESFEAWASFLSGRPLGGQAVCGLTEAARLLFPGRLAHRREELVAELCATDPSRPSPLAVGPEELREALGELVRRFLELEPDVLGTIARTLHTAWRALWTSDTLGARRVENVLSLVEHVESWLDRSRSPRFQIEALRDGRLSTCAADRTDLGAVIEAFTPRWSVEAAAWSACEPVSPIGQGEQAFAREDLEAIDALFEEHLPAIFAEETGTPPESAYRESQHQVARRIAHTFGSRGEGAQLLLVHAPTGTGKTLAYLLPALLWARRHEVRVGVATYTRALQEQAMDRELPRALQALRRAGVELGFRATMLKGRENYLCWRALRLHLPDEDAAGEDWLAWTQLLTFALTDHEGDLDRLPRDPPVAMEHRREYERAFRGTLRQVRAQSGCCRHPSDREKCGAEVARWKAERSHLVITNHSFALARQEFLRHVVFDECEHLHDQAHAAWSHSVGMREVKGLLARVDRPERTRGKSLYHRIARRVVPGSGSARSLGACREACGGLQGAHEEVQRELEAFLRWRDQARRERSEREDHSLLREYVESEEGAGLVAARQAFNEAGTALDQALAEMDERLSNLTGTRLPRLRRALDMARTDLIEILEAVQAWLPLQEGRPKFSSRVFHDVEIDFRGDTRIAARVLLPNEYLGSYYYPRLSTGIFLSATTWLKGGFEAAEAYLGLDRAVEPLPDEDRPPCELSTFRAPEVFDYSRVLVAVPRDAPPIAQQKEAFLQYVRDFVADLGERTRGRMLVLFTNSEDTKRVGARLEGFFHARRIPFWYQNMPGTAKEELSEQFRRRVDSVLLGVDTFWYGADFPGETLEYVVIVRLPYGVPDRYHHAQCAALGATEQRRRIYMPRALAKMRQGFGRLMRRVDDRGCVFLLDGRILDPRHRIFQRELPIDGVGGSRESFARLVRGDKELCLYKALVHMGLENDVEIPRVEESPEEHAPAPSRTTEPTIDYVDISKEDLPF